MTNSESRISTFLHTSSQALIVGAGLIYLFGFVIVSIFDVGYGIADFSLFRTKVIAVGTVFVLLVALGMVVTFRTFSLFGLAFERAEVSAVTVTPRNRILLIADVAISIPFACLGLFFPLSILFGSNIWTGKGFGLVLVTLGVVAGLGVAGGKWFNVHPFLFLFLTGLNTTGLFIILYRYADRGLFWFVVWLSLVCLFTLQTALKLNKRDELHKTEWERMFLTGVIAVFGIYATKVYPKIPHQFGGGAPVPIVLHLTKKAPMFDSESVPVSLIDETEQGFYVIRASDKAIFIARGLVEEVEFVRPMPPASVH